MHGGVFILLLYPVLRSPGLSSVSPVVGRAGDPEPNVENIFLVKTAAVDY
jgi:hypothetical protein